MQLDAQGADDLHDGRELGIAIGTERFVQALTRQAGVARELAHALGAGDIAQRGTDQAAVARVFLQAGVEIKRDVFITFEMFYDIPFAQLCFCVNAGTLIRLLCLK